MKITEYRKKLMRNNIIVLALAVLMFIFAVIISKAKEPEKLSIVLSQALTAVECIVLLIWYIAVMYQVKDEMKNYD